MSDTNNAEAVTAEIRGHVEALFDAFLAKDRAALRDGRTEEGFGSVSKSQLDFKQR